MDSEIKTRFAPSNKKTLNLEPSGEEGLAAFRARLTEEEQAALSQLKASEADLCARWNDAFLMRFIWARKMDVARAAELLKNHIAWRQEYGIDDAFDMAAVGSYFRNPSNLWTPGNYTKQGYSVSYIIARNFDKEALGKLGMRGMLQASYFSLDMTLDHDMDTARKGGVIVEDFSGASFFDLMAMAKGESSLDMKKMMDAMQNHLPFRIGGIIIVNAPWYIRLLMALTKPMLKPKLRKKIHVCSVAELSEYFTPEQLPTFFGGQFQVNAEWVAPFLARRTRLSEGVYVDPSPRSPELVEQLTGEHPVRSVSELAAEAKSKEKSTKSPKSDRAESSSSPN